MPNYAIFEIGGSQPLTAPQSSVWQNLLDILSQNQGISFSANHSTDSTFEAKVGRRVQFPERKGGSEALSFINPRPSSIKTQRKYTRAQRRIWEEKEAPQRHSQKIKTDRPKSKTADAAANRSIKQRTHTQHSTSTSSRQPCVSSLCD
jgi:cell division protein FtsN